MGGHGREQVVGRDTLTHPVHESLLKLAVGRGIPENRPKHVQELRQSQILLVRKNRVTSRKRR
ncbi:hypothetical protein [Streptomyces sp. DSM 40907]|uniref:hypothetical protein n=1 Tax=Streptomyces kutzneri TaxID=3051179 RepID=UPI0028D385B1|nr:hypothetical protein [Streptomyces sp. DSM 40907]